MLSKSTMKRILLILFIFILEVSWINGVFGRNGSLSSRNLLGQERHACSFKKQNGVEGVLFGRQRLRFLEMNINSSILDTGQRVKHGNNCNGYETYVCNLAWKRYGSRDSVYKRRIKKSYLNQNPHLATALKLIHWKEKAPDANWTLHYDFSVEFDQDPTISSSQKNSLENVYIKEELKLMYSIFRNDIQIPFNRLIECIPERTDQFWKEFGKGYDKFKEKERKSSRLNFTGIKSHDSNPPGSKVFSRRSETFANNFQVKRSSPSPLLQPTSNATFLKNNEDFSGLRFINKHTEVFLHLHLLS